MRTTTNIIPEEPIILDVEHAFNKFFHSHGKHCLSWSNSGEIGRNGRSERSGRRCRIGRSGQSGQVGKVVEIDGEKSMKLESSPQVTKSKRSLHWCRSISKKNTCAFFLLQYQSKSYYIIGQEVYYSIGRFITLSGNYYIIGRFVLHYRARITVSGVYYIIGWCSCRGTNVVNHINYPDEIALFTPPSKVMQMSIHVKYDITMDVGPNNGLILGPYIRVKSNKKCCLIP